MELSMLPPVYVRKFIIIVYLVWKQLVESKKIFLIIVFPFHHLLILLYSNKRWNVSFLWKFVARDMKFDWLFADHQIAVTVSTIQMIATASVGISHALFIQFRSIFWSSLVKWFVGLFCLFVTFIFFST